MTVNMSVFGSWHSRVPQSLRRLPARTHNVQYVFVVVIDRSRSKNTTPSAGRHFSTYLYRTIEDNIWLKLNKSKFFREHRIFHTNFKLLLSSSHFSSTFLWCGTEFFPLISRLFDAPHILVSPIDPFIVIPRPVNHLQKIVSPIIFVQYHS
jgi:hypothetical protein